MSTEHEGPLSDRPAFMERLRRAFRTRHNFYAFWALAAAALLFTLPPDWIWEEEPFAQETAPAVPPAEETVPVVFIAEWREERVPRNATFESLMLRLGLDRARAYEAAEALKPVFNVRRIRAGETARAAFDESGTLLEWRYPVDPERTLSVAFAADGGIVAEIEHEPFEWEARAVRGVIESSLYGTLAPVNRALAAHVAQIFAWEVDFQYDLRKGDAVEVLYESASKPATGEVLGRVLAARLTLSGKEHHAYFFRTASGEGYYDETGRSLKKQFLRMPVKFGRLTSGFSTSRFHPVLKQRRPHHGVDYAAPTGTPVHATADGAVVESARKRAEGNYVRLRHANGYETWYMHFSRFASGIRPGVRVKQGQTIGYVGSTGLSTGPHAHYGMKLAGKWVDPRRMTPPPAPPIPAEEATAFASVRGVLASAMERHAGDPGVPRRVDLRLPEGVARERVPEESGM